MYKTKKFPDYKKAFVKVGSSPADSSSDLDDEEWEGLLCLRSWAPARRMS